MQKSLEFVWGDGEGVEKSYKKAKAVLVKDISNINISLDKLPDIESVIKLEQFVREREKKKEFVEENNFIDNFISHNDREVIQMRLSERKLFADGAKNPFMVDNDYSRDVENASKYIKFGKK